MEIFDLGGDRVLWPAFSEDCYEAGRDPQTTAEDLIALLDADTDQSGYQSASGQLILAHVRAPTRCFHKHELKNAWLRLPPSPTPAE